MSCKEVRAGGLCWKPGVSSPLCRTAELLKGWDLTQCCWAGCWISARNAFEIHGQNLGLYQTRVLGGFQKTDPTFVKTVQAFCTVFAKRWMEPCNSCVLCSLKFSGSISGTCHKLACSGTRARGLEKMPWEPGLSWQAVVPHNSGLTSWGIGFQELCQSDLAFYRIRLFQISAEQELSFCGLI